MIGEQQQRALAAVVMVLGVCLIGETMMAWIAASAGRASQKQVLDLLAIPAVVDWYDSTNALIEVRP